MHNTFILTIVCFVSSLLCQEVTASPFNYQELSPQSGVLSWQGPVESNIEYWVYGAHEAEFIEEEATLCGIVSEPALLVDDTFSHYHLVIKNCGLETENVQTFSYSTLAEIAPLVIPKATYQFNLTEEQIQKTDPYLLPDTHPLKKKLDKIFLYARATASMDALEGAGFKIITKGHWSDTVVARHSKLEGYYFKMFTDDQLDINEVKKLTNRIKGALVAQEIVDRHGWGHLFKVPRKWLYRLPDAKVILSGTEPKHFLLIAEDMDVYSYKKNIKKWKSSWMTEEKLNAIFILLTEGGFNDSALAFNLPFSHDGRIAVIDTEKFNLWPIPYHLLLKYLNSDMQNHWKHLIKIGGPH